MKKKILFVALVMSSLLSADIFVKGKSNVALSVGAASNYGKDYLLVGVNGSYFVVDNLSVDLYYRGWFNATPTQHELSLGTNYYLPAFKKFRPYGGVFVREIFVSGRDNYGAYGVRGGVAMMNTASSYLSFGYAYERYTNCNFGECSNSYPEITAGISF